MTANQAVEIILDPNTRDGFRNRLRTAVYRVFDEMHEEATGKRPRQNQGVWEALKRWKEAGREVREGG